MSDVRVCSIAPFVPFETAGYAGTDYYLRHLSVLSEFADVTLVAPRGPVSEAGLARYSGSATIRLADRAQHAASGYFRLAASLYRRWHVITLGLDYVKSITSTVQSVEPDIVEAHVPNAVGMLPRIRRVLPDAHIVAIPYDVHSQGLERVLAHRERARGWCHRANRLRVWYARRAEARHLNSADLVLVFSRKDRDLLKSAGVKTRVEVIMPALDEVPMKTVAKTQQPNDHRLLFVGALDREPNIDAVHWLLDEILPLVQERVPDATLTVAGDRAPRSLLDRCAASNGVVLTGYVPDLADVYAAADLVVAPLRLGAGLKFKVGSAMLWGRPLVASHVAAEGYPLDQGLFLSVTDDAPTFAAAVVDGLLDPDQAQAVVARALAWADEEFSTAKLSRTLRVHYMEWPEQLPV